MSLRPHVNETGRAGLDETTLKAVKKGSDLVGSLNILNNSSGVPFELMDVLPKFKGNNKTLFNSFLQGDSVSDHRVTNTSTFVIRLFSKRFFADLFSLFDESRWRATEVTQFQYQTGQSHGRNQQICHLTAACQRYACPWEFAFP